VVGKIYSTAPGARLNARNFGFQLRSLTEYFSNGSPSNPNPRRNATRSSLKIRFPLLDDPNRRVPKIPSPSQIARSSTNA
jgi:hypothetical protein